MATKGSYTEFLTRLRAEMIGVDAVAAIIHSTRADVLARMAQRQTRARLRGREHHDIPEPHFTRDGSPLWDPWEIHVWAVGAGLIDEDGNRLIGYDEIAEMAGFGHATVKKWAHERNLRAKAGQSTNDDFPEPDVILGAGKRARPRHRPEKVMEWLERVSRSRDADGNPRAPKGMGRPPRKGRSI